MKGRRNLSGSDSNPRVREAVTRRSFSPGERKRPKAGPTSEDLKTLADKAYSKLGEEGRERLALNAYLGQIDNPQVAFAVKPQRSPRSMDAAISATLEMESYLVSKAGSAPVSWVELGGEQAVVAAADVSENWRRWWRS